MPQDSRLHSHSLTIGDCGLAVSCTRGGMPVTYACSCGLFPHSCGQHSGSLDSKSEPPGDWQSSVCREGKFFNCCWMGWGDHCGQPVKWERAWSSWGWWVLIGRSLQGCSLRQWSGVEWFWFLTSDVFSVFAVGHPIPVHQTLNPTREQVEELHQTYMEELRKLFEEHKGKYGIPEHHTLVFR